MTLTADQLRRFADVVEQRLGLRVGDRPGVAADIVTRRAAARRETEGGYVHRLGDCDAEELRLLAEEVSVGETYFFRHVEQFQAYADLLPGLAARGGPVRVLSAGCSSGEEPYTLAILAQERLTDPRAVTIDAVDFNPAALARARRGVYSRWALRATTAEHEARWFEPAGRDVAIAARIRAMVTFAEANLIDPAAAWASGPWDVAFCRNVLMYLGEAHARAAVERLARALAPGGHLFLGHAETLRDYPTIDLELCHTHGTFYYQRALHPRVAGTARRMTTSPPAPVHAPPPALRPADDGAWVGDIAAASRRVTAIVDDALGATPAARAAGRAQPGSLEPIRALVCEERFAEAIAALAELAAPIAHTPDAVLLRAVVATQTGETPIALEACRMLISRGEHLASASYLLAICVDSSGDHAASERHAREALAHDPTFAMAGVQLAFLARRRGDRGVAGELFTRAIALLERDDAARLELLGGGFNRAALVRLCRSELDAIAA